MIHAGERTTPVGVVEKGSTVSFLPVADGYVVRVTCCGAGARRLVVESNGDILVEVGQLRRQTLVRCSVGGRCERATDLRPLGDAGGTIFALPGRGMA